MTYAHAHIAYAKPLRIKRPSSEEHNSEVGGIFWGRKKCSTWLNMLWRVRRRRRRLHAATIYTSLTRCAPKSPIWLEFHFTFLKTNWLLKKPLTLFDHLYYFGCCGKEEKKCDIAISSAWWPLLFLLLLLGKKKKKRKLVNTVIPSSDKGSIPIHREAIAVNHTQICKGGAANG